MYQPLKLFNPAGIAGSEPVVKKKPEIRQLIHPVSSFYGSNRQPIRTVFDETVNSPPPEVPEVLEVTESVPIPPISARLRSKDVQLSHDIGFGSNLKKF